jgi:hypothetical protein
MNLNIVCVLRAGGKVGYDASWVEKLKNSLQRNLTLPFRFVCLSDCEVPCERIELEETGDGFWAKLQLFKPGLFNSPVLYLDLDTVICQNIDDIVLSIVDQKFVMWCELDKNIHSSAMMYWDGDYSHLWRLYSSKPIGYWKELYSTALLYGDQALISEHVDHELFTDLLPRSWFHIVGKKDAQLDLSEVRILHFRKVHTKPSTLPDHVLVAAHWI